MSRKKWFWRLAVAATLVLMPTTIGCRGAIFDAAAAGTLDLIHGTVTGTGGYLIFGESPPPLITSAILNAIGSSGGGGGGGGH